MTTELIEEATRHTKRGLFARYAGVVDADILAVRRRALADEARGEWAFALEAYRIAAVLEPGESMHWSGLARCYAKLGDLRLAEQMERCAAAGEASVSDAAAVRAKSVVRMVNSGVRVNYLL
jgi:hypothetical protein